MRYGRNAAWWMVLACLAVTAVGVFAFAPHSKAQVEGPDWINGALKLELVDSVDNPDTEWQRQRSNIPYEPATAEFYSGSRFEARTDNYTYPTTVGYIGYDKVLPIGETRWQLIMKFGTILSDASVYGNPGDSGVIVITNSGPYSQFTPYLYYVNDWRTMLGKISLNYSKTILRTVPLDFNIKDYPTLRKLDGSQLAIGVTSSPAFSKNGDWLYLNSDIGQLRAHLPNLNYQIVAPKNKSTSGKVAAVSNSGRYVISGSLENQTENYIYDTERCSSLTSGDCAKRGVRKYLNDEYAKVRPENFTTSSLMPTAMKFLTESKIEVYGTVTYLDKAGGGYKYKYVKINLSVDTGAETRRYLALGDSFSSGEGAGDYYDVTNFYSDAQNFNRCHQSRVAYSEILNKQLSLDWYDSIACSGAQMKDVVYGNTDKSYMDSKDPQARSNTLSPEYILQNLRVGYIPQLSHIKYNQPNIATISIGGNDIGFGDIVKGCIFGPGCYAFRDDRETLADLIDAKILSAEKTLSEIVKNMQGDSPKVYVLGYPQLFNQYATCGSVMSGQEREFANNLVNYLNDAIRIAAKRVGVRYIDVTYAFLDSLSDKDYRICGNTPKKAANGLIFTTEDSSDNQPFEKYLSESYHPNDLGHSLLASRIRLLSNDFNFVMPEPSLTETRPRIELYRSLVGDGEDRVADNFDVETISDQKVYYKNDLDVRLDYRFKEEDGFPKPDTPVYVFVKSEPIKIGELRVKDDDSVSTDGAPLSLPDELSPGVHTLHLKYEDILGRDHDIIQYIYVFDSPDDLDGDGIPNDQEVCVIGGSLGVNYDKDGVDDACDPDITEPPIENPVSEEPSDDSAATDGDKDDSVKPVSEEEVASNDSQPNMTTSRDNINSMPTTIPSTSHEQNLILGESSAIDDLLPKFDREVSSMKPLAKFDTSAPSESSVNRLEKNDNFAGWLVGTILFAVTAGFAVWRIGIFKK